MQPTRTIASFECRELRALIPHVSQKGKELLDSLPASQKTAAYALRYSHYFTIYPSIPLSFIGLYSFSAVPIGMAIGLAASSFAIAFLVNKIFGSTGNVFLYEKMQKLDPIRLGFANLSYVNSTLSILNLESDAEDLSTRSSSDHNVKPMLEAYRALSFMQIALNELCYALSEDKLDKGQGTHSIKMIKAAKKAMEIFNAIKNNNNLFGITPSHISVTDVLCSSDELSIKEKAITEAGIFSLN